jgi:hypothetical protein
MDTRLPHLFPVFEVMSVHHLRQMRDHLFIRVGRQIPQVGEQEILYVKGIG